MSALLSSNERKISLTPFATAGVGEFLAAIRIILSPISSPTRSIGCVHFLPGLVIFSNRERARSCGRPLVTHSYYDRTLLERAELQQAFELDSCPSVLTLWQYAINPMQVLFMESLYCPNADSRKRLFDSLQLVQSEQALVASFS